MAKRKRAGNSYKAQYSAYKAENRAKKNKISRLEKRLLDNPNDSGAEEALRIVKAKPIDKFRQKPGNKGWFHPQEQILIKALQDKDPEVVKENAEKLKNLRILNVDKRPSALRNNKCEYIPPSSMLEEFHNIGLVNEKRYNFIKSRMAGIRSRRTVSKG